MAKKKDTQTAGASGTTLTSATETQQGNPFVNALLTTGELPSADKLEKLTNPPLVKPQTVPIGKTIIAVIVRLIQNFTGASDMRETLCLHLKHETGREFMFPVTGQIKKAMEKLITYTDAKTRDEKTGKEVTYQKGDLSAGVAGRKLFLTREPDGASKKFGGKPMFLFDVRIEKR